MTGSFLPIDVDVAGAICIPLGHAELGEDFPHRHVDCAAAAEADRRGEHERSSREREQKPTDHPVASSNERYPGCHHADGDRARASRPTEIEVEVTQTMLARRSAERGNPKGDRTRRADTVCSTPSPNVT